MEFVKNYDEYFAAKNSSNELEENELMQELAEFDDLSEEEFIKDSEYIINEEEKTLKVTGQTIDGTAIKLNVNGQHYKFEKTGADVKEIFRKLEKMLGAAKAGFKALKWLEKQLGKGTKIS
jgi:hypothetical protein